MVSYNGHLRQQQPIHLPHIFLGVIERQTPDWTPTMTKTLQALSSALLFSVITPLAVAQNTSNMPPPPANEAEITARFNAADKNGDGKVTREEAQATMPRVAMAWEKIDVDKKGYITLEQLLIISANNQ